MAHLIDTSILGRLANTADIKYPIAARTLAELRKRGETLCLAPQVLIEFRNMATRPQAVNGMGMAASQADAVIAGFEGQFPLLPETPDIYPAWKTVVQALGVIGKQVHDARLVAVCHVHAVSHLLTFNVGHFTRFAGLGAGRNIVDPATI